MFISKKFKSQKGITLLELIIAISIFAVTVIAATEIFKMVLVSQRSSLAAKNLQENMRYTFESIAKEIRMAYRDNGECADLNDGLVYQPANNNTELYLKNYHRECVHYFLDSGRFKVSREDSATHVTVTNFITPDEINISNLQFEVIDDGANATTQPRVTMKMDIATTGKAEQRQQMKIQTTLSSRYYR